MTTLSETMRSVTGTEPTIAGVRYGADMRLLVNEGKIPTVLFGPGDVREAHRPDEKISKDVHTLVEDIEDQVNAGVKVWSERALNSKDSRFVFKRESLCDVGMFLQKFVSLTVQPLNFRMMQQIPSSYAINLPGNRKPEQTRL